MKPTSAIAIVTYNSAGCIGRCLESALARSRQVLVVDNASEDPTRQIVARYSAVRLIANRTNRGFAGAVNQALGTLEADCVLLLNPDAELLTEIEPLTEACAEPNVAAAAGKLIDGQGRVQSGFNVRSFPSPTALAFEALGLNRLFPHNPVNRRYRRLDLDPDRPGDVEQPAGAFLMIRREVWKRLGGFDERFHPVFFEEVDFLARAARQGYRIRYVPAAAACHLGGHSVRALPRSKLRQYWYSNLLRYAEKHFGRGARAAVAAAVLAGAMARIGAGVFGRERGAALAGHGKVIPLAAKHLFWAPGRAEAAGTAAGGSVG